MVGLVEHLARAQAQGVHVIAQGQAARADEVAAAHGILGLEKHALLHIGGIDNLHHQIVAVRLGQPIGDQLAHADHRHHVAVGLILRLPGSRRGAHRRHQQYPG